MEQLSLGFIGGGRITRIFLLSFRNKKARFKQIKVSEIQKDVSETLADKFPEIQIAGIEEVMQQDIILSTIHPPALLEYLNHFKGKITDQQILVSISPKLGIKQMSDTLGGFANLARFVPNAPSVINKGYNPVSYGTHMKAENKQILYDLLSILGKCVAIEENKLEPYSLLTAMGPTYFWFQLYELQKLGKSYGLSDKEIEESITEMINGSIHTLFESNMSREEVLDLIPVKPLAEIEDIVSESYEQVLTILSKKLKII